MKNQINENDIFTDFFSSEPIKEEKTIKQDNKQHNKQSTNKARNTNQDKEEKQKYFTFKINNDLYDYFNNIMWITRETKLKYLNDLIKADLIKRVGLKPNASDEEIQKAWSSYKDKNFL